MRGFEVVAIGMNYLQRRLLLRKDVVHVVVLRTKGGCLAAGGRSRKAI